MKLARRSYFYRTQKKSVEMKQAEAELPGKIKTICLKSPQYLSDDIFISIIQKYYDMGESTLLDRVKQRCRETTNSQHSYTHYSNIFRGMTISRPDQVRLSDITYIRIRTGFVYLAAILCAYSRHTIGYAVSARLEFSF